MQKLQGDASTLMTKALADMQTEFKTFMDKVGNNLEPTLVKGAGPKLIDREGLELQAPETGMVPTGL